MMNRKGIFLSAIILALMGQTAFSADLDNNGIEDSYEQALAEKFCSNYGISSIEESVFFPLFTRRGIVPSPQEKYERYLRSTWNQSSSYERSSSFLLNGNFLRGEDTESDKRRTMGIGEQLVVAYLGGCFGMITTSAITAKFLSAKEGRKIEDGWGAAIFTVMVGGTVGIPVGSAVLLNIPMPKYKRFSFSRFGWTLLGAVIPTALTTTVELLRPGHSGTTIIIGWCLAPIGAVIGYNLAD